MFSAPKSDEEWRKQITMALKDGTPVVVIDNVTGRLDNPDLCKVLTATYHVDRAMKTHDKLMFPVKCTWIATANNVQVAGDMPRRCYWIRIDAKTSNPFQRTGFKIPDLKRWSKDNRGELLASLWTIARAWFAAGKPRPDKKPLGSFECWSQTIGGILEFVEVPGFLDNAIVLYEDAESMEWEAFLLQLHETFYGAPFTVAELFAATREEKYEDNRMQPTMRAEALRAALPSALVEGVDRNGHFQRRAGNCFADRIGRRFGKSEVHIERHDIYHHAQRWKVEGVS